jgi:hypothetical protein
LFDFVVRCRAGNGAPERSVLGAGVDVIVHCTSASKGDAITRVV